MKLQDLSIEQLKEIVEGAPEGATHYDYDDGLYLKTAYGAPVQFSREDQSEVAHGSGVVPAQSEGE